MAAVVCKDKVVMDCIQLLVHEEGVEVGIANWSQIVQDCWSMRKGCNCVLPSDSGWSCLIFVYVQ